MTTKINKKELFNNVVTTLEQLLSEPEEMIDVASMQSEIKQLNQELLAKQDEIDKLKAKIETDLFYSQLLQENLGITNNVLTQYLKAMFDTILTEFTKKCEATTFRSSGPDCPVISINTLKEILLTIRKEYFKEG